MENSQFWRYRSWNTRYVLQTIPKLDCLSCALQGLMKGEAKGTELTGSAWELCIFFWRSNISGLSALHVMAWCGQTWTHSINYTVSWKTSFLPSHPPTPAPALKNTFGNNFISTFISTTFCSSLLFRIQKKQQSPRRVKGYIFVLVQFICTEGNT